MFFSDLFDYIKPALPKILIFIVIFYLDTYVIQPYVENKYFRFDLADYNNSWQYFILTFVIIYICFIIYTIAKKFKIQLVSSILLILPSILLAFFFQDHTKNLTLLLNANYEKEVFLIEYKIQRYNQNEVFQLYDDISGEIILFEDELDRINKIRKSNNLNSIYELKNEDRIIVTYCKGFLDIKFLK